MPTNCLRLTGLASRCAINFKSHNLWTCQRSVWCSNLMRLCFNRINTLKVCRIVECIISRLIVRNAKHNQSLLRSGCIQVHKAVWQSRIVLTSRVNYLNWKAKPVKLFKSKLKGDSHQLNYHKQQLVASHNNRKCIKLCLHYHCPPQLAMSRGSCLSRQEAQP